MFDKLAHASIMRLNSNSMDKLYDLMTMAVKYQVSKEKRQEPGVLDKSKKRQNLPEYESSMKYKVWAFNLCSHIVNLLVLNAEPEK